MSRQKWQFAKIIVAFLGMFIARGALLGLREPRRASELLRAWAARLDYIVGR